mgnify:CR=1 FL=1
MRNAVAKMGPNEVSEMSQHQSKQHRVVPEREDDYQPYHRVLPAVQENELPSYRATPIIGGSSPVRGRCRRGRLRRRPLGLQAVFLWRPILRLRSSAKHQCVLSVTAAFLLRPTSRASPRRSYCTKTACRSRRTGCYYRQVAFNVLDKECNFVFPPF